MQYSGLWELLAVFLALYLLEGVSAAPRETLQFARGPFGVGHRARGPWGEFGRGEWGLLLWPLAPWREGYLASTWTVISDSGGEGRGDRAWITAPAHLLPPLARQPLDQLPRMPTSGIVPVRREGSRLEIDGLRVLTAHPSVAQSLLEDLGRGSLEPRDRARHHLAVEAARVAIRDAEYQGRWVRRLVSSTTAALVACAAIALGWGVNFALWPAMAVLLSANVAIATATFAAHRKLHPELADQRGGAVVLWLLFPPAALRAYQWLTRGATCTFHPLAVALALGDEARARDFRDAALRDLRHPAPIDGAPLTAVRQALLDAILQVSPEDPPPSSPHPADTAEPARCPRCLDPYLRTTGNCDRCPDVSLVPN